MAKKPVSTQPPQAVTGTDLATLMPRFAASMALRTAEDHWVMDFYFGNGTESDPRVHLARIAITPQHAFRMHAVLGRQLKAHQEFMEKEIAKFESQARAGNQEVKTVTDEPKQPSHKRAKRRRS